MDEAHDVPTAEDLLPLADPPMVAGVCPACGDAHGFDDLVQSLGPLARDYDCPSTSERLFRVFNDGDGWTWWKRPGWNI